MLDTKDKNNNSSVRKENNLINFPNENVLMLNSDQNISNDIYSISLECLKQSKISGSPEEIAQKFIEIYNSLKENMIKDNQKRQIQTVFDDYIICLEDGKKMKMLRRHLRTRYNMTFQEYKKKWNLPFDYPYVCKNYSKISY